MPINLTDEVSQTWSDIADEKSENNWMLTHVVGKDVHLVETNDSGLLGLKDCFTRHQDKVMFGCFKIVGVDNRHEHVVSKRPKYVYTVFIGTEISTMKKMKAKMASEEVREKLFGDTCQYTIPTFGEQGELDLFTKESVAQTLLNAGGAHKPVYYDFGPDQRVQLVDLLGDAACLQAKGVTLVSKR